MAVVKQRSICSFTELCRWQFQFDLSSICHILDGFSMATKHKQSQCSCVVLPLHSHCLLIAPEIYLDWIPLQRKKETARWGFQKLEQALSPN